MIVLNIVRAITSSNSSLLSEIKLCMRFAKHFVCHNCGVQASQSLAC